MVFKFMYDGWYCLISILTPLIHFNMSRSFEKVRWSPINKSPAKYSYQFGRAPRFKYTARDIQPNLSETSRRYKTNGPVSPSFGDRRISSPSPQDYRVPSFTEEARKKQKGIKIHQSQRMKQKINMTAFEPGPSTYHPHLNNTTHGVRIAPPRNTSRHQNNWVGPGLYNVEKYGTKNDGVCSTFKKTVADCKFGKAPRFRPQTARPINAEPGPGQYEYFSQFAERRTNLSSKLQKMQQMVSRR